MMNLASVLVSASLICLSYGQPVKHPETLLTDLSLKAEALLYFEDLASGYFERLANQFWDASGEPYEELAPGPDPDLPPPPPILHAPCDGKSPMQQLLYVSLDPKADYSSEATCKHLSKLYNQGFDQYHGCKYGNAVGGKAYPETNSGQAKQPYGPLGISVVTSGSCSNIYFGATPGMTLEAPKIDENGQCDPFDKDGVGAHSYQQGYDFLLFCDCICPKPHQVTYPRHSPGTGKPDKPLFHEREPYHESGFGHQPHSPKHAPLKRVPYGAPEPGYGDAPHSPHSPHSSHSPHSPHSSEYGYVQERTPYGEPVYGHHGSARSPHSPHSSHGGYEEVKPGHGPSPYRRPSPYGGYEEVGHGQFDAIDVIYQ
eukprot:GHVN01104246.1.p1 GENE.GHVN01104246.1~~GHVN01104246.1.p1  ORF type:complete len:370 (+),score=65.54 GHVN01104246.1:170-1279(+)